MDSNRIKDIDARHGTQNENGNGARDAATVSYTHLTLPTN